MNGTSAIVKRGKISAVMVRASSAGERETALLRVQK